MDKELACDFVFGDKCGDIKKMNYDLLDNSVTEVTNIQCKGLVYQKEVPSLIFKPYDKYIALGQPSDISTWGLLLLSKLTSKKVYLWTHGWYGRETFAKKIIKKLFFGLADGLLIYGDYAIDLMVKEGFKRDKLFAIHNSLDYDTQKSIRRELKPSSIFNDHFNNSSYNLIFIGRLTKVKKLDFILDVLKISDTKYNLTYIGTGEDEARLKNLVKEYNLDNRVWFYGACYDEKKLAELIFNADLCIAPGNVGLTSIHCLSYGCPVVTHNNYPMQMPEFEVIKSGVTGDFFEYKNVDSLCEVVEKWFSQVKDREAIRMAAYNIIDESWNPYYQIKTIKKMLNSK